MDFDMKTGTCTNWKLLRLEKNGLISLKYHAKLELYILSIMQQLELDMKQQTGSKSGKEYIKAVYCHPAYLTYAEYIIGNARLDETRDQIANIHGIIEKAKEFQKQKNLILPH